MILLFVLLPAGLIYYYREQSGLVNYLPADTPFYLSLSLPQAKKWFTPWLVWQRADKPNTAVSGLYQKLDLISWPNASWSEKILPLFSGRIELARLPLTGPSPTGGGLVLKARLNDRAAWFGLFNLKSDYGGEVLTFDLAMSGAWGALTKNPNKIVWRILGNDLYLSDNADILGQLPAKRTDSLARQLKSLKAKVGLALIYAKDKDFLAIDNPYIKALSQSAAYPLVIGFSQAEKAVNFNIYGEKSSAGPIKSTALAERLYEFDSAFYGQNLASAYTQAEASLPDNLKNNFWPILQNFYGVDKAAALTEFGVSEIFLVFSGTDWLLNIANKTPENSNLLATLKKAGAALFAITHPEAVEQPLGDGTKLVELRAQTAGLAWREEPWSYAAGAVKMESLSGQGEKSGYYVGFVPDLGYILTTAMPLLNQYAANSEAAVDVKNSGCFMPKNMLMAASIPIKHLTANELWQAIASKIIITMPQADKISGCVLLKD